jgi:hypothetical protein
VLFIIFIHFRLIFTKICRISPNVPAVYDVFARPIKETVGFQGLQKCGWKEPWERSDLGDWNPGAAIGGGAYTVLLCEVPVALYFI